MQLFEQIV